MTQGRSLFKCIWIVASGIVLVATLWLNYPGPHNDVEILLTYSMLFLSFPSSCLVLVVEFGLAHLISIYWGTVPIGSHSSLATYISLTVQWLTFFAIGYFQWFYLLPYMKRRWKERKQGPKING